MANLAGFDTILEFSRGFVEDTFLSTSRGVLAGGDKDDTFAPPFSWSLTFPVVSTVATAQIIIQNVHLSATPQTTDIAIRFEFSGSSLMLPFFPQPLSQLAGSMTLSGRLALALDDKRVTLVLETGSVNVTCDFDAASKSLMNSQFANLAAWIKNGAEGMLQSQIRSVPTATLGPLPLTVNTLTASEDPTVVNAMPALRWIDGETLGIFGQYRIAPLGNPALKTTGDLDPTVRRGIAILYSEAGFEQVWAHPSIRSYVRDTVGEVKRGEFLAQEKAKTGNNGAPTEAEITAAQANLSTWLASSDGVATVAAQTPPPTGGGVLPRHVDPPDPFPGTEAQVREISASLVRGAIQVHYRADAEIFCGTVKVEQSMRFPFSIAPGGGVAVDQPIKDPVSTDIPSDMLCRAALTAIGAAIGGISGGIAGFFALSLTFSFVEDRIAEKIAQIAYKPGAPQALGIPVSWTAIQCDESGLIVRGNIHGVVADPVPFNPTVAIAVRMDRIDDSTTLRQSNAKTNELTGVLCKPPEGAVFHYRRAVGLWKVTLTIHAQDVPLPVKVGDWYVQLGYRVKSLGFLTVHLDEQRHVLRPGDLTAPATVWNPEPPLEGALVENTEVHLKVEALDEPGFVLTTNWSNLNYVLEVTTSVVDASGRLWSPSVRVFVDGLVITPGEDIQTFLMECDRFLHRLNDRFAKSIRVSPWDSRFAELDRLRNDLFASFKRGEVGIASALGDAAKEHGDAPVFQIILGKFRR